MKKVTKYHIAFGLKRQYCEIQALINIQRELRKSVMSNHDFFTSLGVEDGLIFGFNNKHTGTIDSFISIKQEIKDMQEDPELFECEIYYKNGYLQGLQRVLDSNRTYFEKETRVLTAIFTPDEDIAIKYNLAFSTYGYIPYSEISNDKLMYIISNSVNDLSNILSKADSQLIETSICVIIGDKKKYPSVEELKILSECGEYPVFLIKDHNTLNLKNIITKIESTCIVV